jgi:hypothetical protein
MLTKLTITRPDNDIADSSGDESDSLSCTLTNTGDHVALFVRLALRDGSSGSGSGSASQRPPAAERPFAVFSENFVCLLPGESLNVTATLLNKVAGGTAAAAAAAAGPVLCADAWNVAMERCIAV